MTIIRVPFHQDERLPDDSVPVGGETVEPALPDGAIWERLTALHDAVADRVARQIRAGAVPTVVSGDCLVALGTVAGVQRAGVDPGLVWFDAHGDVHTLDTTTSGYLGGLSLRLALGAHPDLVAGPLGLRPVERALLVGARDLDPAEVAYLSGDTAPAVRAVDDLGARPRDREAAAPIVDDLGALPRRSDGDVPAAPIVDDLGALPRGSDGDVPAAPVVADLGALPDGPLVLHVDDLGALPRGSDGDVPAAPVVADLGALPDGPLVLHVDVDVIDDAELPGLLFPAPDGPSAAAVHEAMRRILATGRVVALDIACPWHPAPTAEIQAARRDLLATLTS
ncbi:arginase family protein [Asanoa sp. WMMD1127]|uniref:arginase family protein n=1 Tax=Asanoa sp. WMMD1127 TaxID=3016107 RepID=UPI002417D505|nr:arginase family protein [Asanoa sp. WMMD1127]MDG4826058.1 arginase family protein [Asanoa sp. WMMD1127]